MSGSVTFRPLREADLRPVHDVNVRAFEDLARRMGEAGQPAAPNLEAALGRLRRLLTTDPDGAWVAERGGEIAGAALALLREGLWGLSLLVVDPGAQSSGAGRELLARAFAYGAGARGHVILSSSDPRAMRAYARLGLETHPCVAASGRPQGVAMPEEVRPGGPEDLPLTEAVDRAVRGAAHGGDLLTMLEGGHELLVAPGRGYAFLRGGQVRMVAAFDEDGARAALRGALARVGERGEEAHVDFISARQQWAIEVCLDARLELRADAGCVFTAGDVGPFRPYLPSGAYL
jgi:GNAT superfamily N-acetyltransferase